jgi:hypothetical protein
VSDIYLDPARKHDAVLLFDVTDGNPNGDPDNAGAPPTDLETGHGIVTDVALKRKIRDVVPSSPPAARDTTSTSKQTSLSKSATTAPTPPWALTRPPRPSPWPRP